jgi:DNA-binding CsgD family transcriptional regulator
VARGLASAYRVLVTQLLVGRAAELNSVLTRIEHAREGRGGVLAIVGPPGIGKSVLLDAAASEVSVDDQVEVLRLVGAEAERDVPFAGLSALLAPLLDLRDTLVEVQRRALSVALGLTDGPAPGRMVLGGAVLALLSARSQQRTIAVLVDDLQWVDRPSAEAIVFAARRLQAERVAVLFGARPAESGEADQFGQLLRSIPTLGLDGLPAGQCHRLLPQMASEVAAALAGLTGGNPLAMVEAASLLDADVRAGIRPLPQTLPPTSVGESYRSRLDLLPAGAREGCRLLAVAGRASADVLEGALAKLSLSLADLEPFEETGLGRVARNGTVWRHPLVRSVAAEGTAEQVRRLHAVLAECWASVPGGRPQWAWHMAEAVSGPNQEVAQALAEIAAASAEREASLDAADAWERAAYLSENPGARCRWLGAAARTAFRGGAAARAAHLYDLALQSTAPNVEAGVRALQLHERGRVEHGLGRPTSAYSLFMEATRARGGNPVWAAAEAVYAGMYAKRPDLVAAAATAAVAVHDPNDATQRFLALHAQGAAAALVGEPETARHRMAETTELLLRRRLLDDAPDLLLWAVNADLFVADPMPALPAYVRDAVARVRQSGELMWSPRVVRLVGVRDYARGAWGPAYAAFEEATELSRLSGQLTQVAEGLLCQAAVEAARGQEEPCREHTEEAAAIVKDLEVRWLGDGVWEIRGVMHLTRQEHEAAARCFSRNLELDPDAIAGLVEAMIGSGNVEQARDALHAYTGDKGSIPFIVAQCLVDDDQSAARRLTHVADKAESPFDSARWLLAAGSILRRSGLRREARQQLRSAEQLFAAIEAPPWLMRVHAELRASGATLRRGPETPSLTPSELRVATLVAEGRSNKEVAAALFLSTKTVEFHLGRAFRKLGVRNRTALAARLTDQPRPLS